MKRTGLACLAAVVLTACPGGGGDDDGGNFDAGLHLDGGLHCQPGTSTLRVGQMEQLGIAGLDAGALRWSSTAPTIADVSSSGVVTAAGLGMTQVVGETDTDYGVCDVNVISLCQDIGMVSSWTGALTVDFAGMASGSTNFSLNHHASVTFTLTQDPASPYQWVGQATGSGSIAESEVISGGADVHQTGSGTAYTVGNLTLTVDPVACTFSFDWLWAIDTVYTVSGASMSLPQVNVGDVASDAQPFTPDWSTSGISVTGAFPSLGMSGAGASGNKYVLLTQIAQAYFNANPTSHGPAQVAFVFAPTQ